MIHTYEDVILSLPVHDTHNQNVLEAHLSPLNDFRLSMEHITFLEAELTAIGFKPLRTADEVASHFENDLQGTTLFFVNSLCGCAGTGARAGVSMALEHSVHGPDHLLTVFAGIDEAATAQLFEYTKPYPPSAPAIALFRGKELVHFVERHQIKGSPVEALAADLQQALEACCAPTPLATVMA